MLSVGHAYKKILKIEKRPRSKLLIWSLTELCEASMSEQAHIENIIYLHKHLTTEE
jgi:hypothetical protein